MNEGLFFKKDTRGTPSPLDPPGSAFPSPLTSPLPWVAAPAQPLPVLPYSPGGASFSASLQLLCAVLFQIISKEECETEVNFLRTHLPSNASLVVFYASLPRH